MYIVEDADGIKRGVFWWQPVGNGMPKYPTEDAAFEAAQAFARLSKS